MHPTLRLHEDQLAGNAEAQLPALARMIFVVRGGLSVGGRALGEGEVWHGEGAAAIAAGKDGATCWRFELTEATDRSAAINGAGVSSAEKLSAPLASLPAGDLLWRGDSVAFPPGGCAYLHTHQGPGIRCLVEGGIRIDSNGHSAAYAPGEPWFESGPEPVFAQAAADRPSRFIRVMILPRSLLGKSSIRYVNADDAAKPKTQQYKVFVDAPIAFAPG